MAAPMMVSHREEDSMNTEASMSGRQIIGIIYPPPEIRTIVDKTAAFVARNGIDFENKIREKEATNPRFSFLSITDPYYAYYQHKVREFQEGIPVEASAPRPQVPDAVKEHVRQREFIPTKPPPPFEFMADPATINAFDLDLIKLTAIFAARNGRAFLLQLMNRESRNFQFDFLKPQHSNFSYFSKLVEQYTKVMIPKKGIIEDLHTESGDTKKLMNDINYRVAWEKHQRGLREKEEAEQEKERLAYAQIDWHDFVVVQTVDFPPGETAPLPGLCTPKDVGARMLLEAREEAQKAALQSVAMDVGSDSESEEEEKSANVPAVQRAAYEVTQPAPVAPSDANVTIRDYDPKKAHPGAKKAGDDWLISPLTGERIPRDKFEEHVRYNTIDSQYKEDRERLMGERRDDEPVYAPGAEVGRLLSRFAERRTDIFGVGEKGAEQTAIGKKLGEEDAPPPPQKIIWDGQASTIDATTRAAQQQVSLEQQVQDIQRQHGMLSDPSKERIGAQAPAPPANAPRPPAPAPLGLAPPIPGPPVGAFPLLRTPIPPPIVPVLAVPLMQAPVGMPVSMQPSVQDGPPAKRARTEEELEPEADWLKKVNGDVELRVQLPEAPEWNLDGKVIPIKINMTSPISTLKQIIQDTTGMPAPKQKLQFEGFFLKDQMSLAYYNMSNQAFVSVKEKERGGRKK